MKKVYFNVPLKNSLKGWHDEWFYIENSDFSLFSWDGKALVVNDSWNAMPSAKDMEEVN
uniref:Uncharacterized protein n=1 Tax=Arundo donax TaxID=35708 RepID=A0A0A8ZCI9_ARUDO